MYSKHMGPVANSSIPSSEQIKNVDNIYIANIIYTEINLSLQNKRIWYKYSVNLITFVVERKRLTLRQVNKGNNRTTSPFSAYDLSE